MWHAYTYADCVAHSNGYAHRHAYSNSYRHAECYADRYGKSHSYIDTFSNSYWHAECYANGYRKSNRNSLGQANTNAQTCSYARIAAYSASTPDPCAASALTAPYSSATSQSVAKREQCLLSSEFVRGRLTIIHRHPTIAPRAGSSSRRRRRRASSRSLASAHLSAFRKQTARC